MAFDVLLVVICCWLNRHEGKMLLLTLAVSGGFFMNIPVHNFYIWCIAVEICVWLAADVLEATASRSIVCMSMSLCLWHFMGMWLNGSSFDSPYRVLVVVTEYSEFAACILLSKPFLELTRKILKDKENV